MSSKVSLQDLNRNKRAQKNAKFADKKILLTRRAILDRIGKYVFDSQSLPRSKKKKPIKYEAIVYLRRKRNNIYLTLTDLRGKVVTTSSSGFFGFKNYASVLPNAAQASAKRISFFLKTAKIKKIALIVKSKVPAVVFGVIRGFTALGIRVNRLMDRIPIAHNGVKRKKARRK